MAKYSLNGKREQVCAILDENYINNTYKVRFADGKVKNVSKSHVYNLNKLDEGVLDRLKKLGKSLLDKVVSVGKYVYLKLGGRRVDTLFNVMINAEEKDGMSFYPSKTFAAVCDKAGVEPTISEDDSADNADAAMVNTYWKNKMKQFRETSDEAIAAANESYSKSSFVYRQRLRLYESDEIELAQGPDGFDNVNTAQVQQKLIDQYRLFLFEGVGKQGKESPIPYLIWGAPGIGKTQIVKGIISMIREAGLDANVISLNARTMRRDDFALPATYKREYNVKTNDGDVTISDMRSGEITKEWLPAYNPGDARDGVTIEMLDDIANGGDGSGNGVGGFIFIDELSRVPREVMEPFMDMVQSRQFGVRAVGSKWMFVFAANRLSDMGERGEDVHWESAYTGRFSHVNFVPTFNEWLIWAEGTNSDGKQRIEPVIINFLKEHKELWYNSKAGNDNDDEVVNSMYPTGRGWENVTKEMRERTSSMNALNNETDPSHKFMAAMYNKLGLNKTKRDLSPKEISDIIRHHNGNKAADVFSSWDGFDAKFTADIAASVWKLGDKADIPFEPNILTILNALSKIFANNPKVKATSRKVTVTNAELMNIFKYVVAMVKKGDNGRGNTKANLLKAAWAGSMLRNKLVPGIVSLLMEPPYNIDLRKEDTPDWEKYSDEIDYYEEEACSTLRAVGDAFGDDE